MRIDEIINRLKTWPGDAEVEISIPYNLHSDTPEKEEKVWIRIEDVEYINPVGDNTHCLIYGKTIVME